MDEGPDFTAQDALSRGAQCLKDGRYQDAVAHFTDAVALQPDCFDGYMGLGLAHAQLGNYELAADAFASCLRIQPRSARACHNYAAALQALGDTERAAEYYRRAASLDPSYEAPRRALAEMARSSTTAISDSRILCHCPRCGTPALKHSPGTYCRSCGLDLAGVYHGRLVVHADLDGRETFTCASCGAVVEDVTGSCPRCGAVLCGPFQPTPRVRADEVTLAPSRRDLSWGKEAVAPLWKRLLAVWLDGALLGAAAMILRALLGASLRESSAVLLMAWMLYEGLFVGRYGATPGKMWCDITVEMVDGRDVGYGTAFLRAFLKWLLPMVQSLLVMNLVGPKRLDPTTWSGLLAQLGLTISVAHVWALWDPLKQTLYDKLARTVVTQ